MTVLPTAIRAALLQPLGPALPARQRQQGRVVVDPLCRGPAEPRIL